MIGILTIATGKYLNYVESLIESCEKNFLTGHGKNYFIFTDGNLESKFKNVYLINQNQLGWPFDTMMRFHMFNSIKDDLERMDYLFFFNANMLVVEEVNDSILPNNSNSNLVAALHPGYINSENYRMPFEGRIESSFFVKPGDRKKYVQGCFNGGRSKDFLEMCEKLKILIDKDVSNGIIPIWHDESALNWYLKDKSPLLLDPTYAYPDHCLSGEVEKLIRERPDLYNFNISVDFSDQLNAALARKKDPYDHILNEFGNAKIIQRDKFKDGGTAFLRK